MKEEQKLEAKYGLFMAISMVIGQVIGSGIFFKVDDVLIATDGNVYAGLLGFLDGKDGFSLCKLQTLSVYETYQSLKSEEKKQTTKLKL